MTDLYALEEQLNKELQSSHQYEDWMSFSLNPLGRGFSVGYVLPSNHGIATEVTLQEAVDLYHTIQKRVFSN